MRTTINLEESLIRAAKEHAARTGRTLTAVIEDALRHALAPRGSSEKDEPLQLPTYGGGGLQPGVDLDDSAGLLDVMG